MVRQSELEKVERSIIEVRDMFLRISTLVMEQVRQFTQSIGTDKHYFRGCLLQSPLITLAEYHAHQATLNIDKGAGKLEKARDLKIKRLKVNIRFLPLFGSTFNEYSFSLQLKTWILFWLTIILIFCIIILVFLD